VRGEFLSSEECDFQLSYLDIILICHTADRPAVRYTYLEGQLSGILISQEYAHLSDQRLGLLICYTTVMKTQR